jgi:acetyl coenzyme A synthetase (ADP forming)-like protein
VRDDPLVVESLDNAPDRTTVMPVQVEAPPLDVILRDGRTLRLRPPRLADAAALRRFFDQLTDRSRYLRFHGMADVDAAVLRRHLDPDWTNAGCYVGVEQRGRRSRIVAVGNYIRIAGSTEAEAAFAVTDALQGHGVGTRLLECLAAAAHRAGISAFWAEVLAADAPMLGVFSHAGFETQMSGASGTVRVRFPIAATPELRERIDARDHEAVRRSMEPLLAPRSVAVIGASSRRGSIGGELFRNMLDAGFAGPVHPVNRTGTPVAGHIGYSRIADIGEAVDLAVVCVPGASAVGQVREALDAGTRSVCVITAGFSESGGAGRRRERRLLELVRSRGVRLVGPNCLGIAVPALGLNATFAPGEFPKGTIGFSSQSGALGLAVLEHARRQGLGLSGFVSVGNKADVSSNDLLEWWDDDPDTNVVMLYMESFGNPHKFARLARRVSRHKPVIALKAGATTAGARAAGSHTAALAGSDTAVDALFHQAGVIRVRTLEELIDLAGLLSRQPLPAGPRVAVLTNAGGLGILCADACEVSGLTLPALTAASRRRLRAMLPAEASVTNPVDMLGSATADGYRQALPVLVADPNVDAVIALFAPPVVADPGDVAAAIDEATRTAGADKPVLAAVMGAARAASNQGPATFDYPESAAGALARAVQYVRLRDAPVTPPADRRPADTEVVERIVAAALADEDDVWLDPDDTQTVLEAYGIPCPTERIATTDAAAVEAAGELGYPVAVKTARPGAHKTELGAIALGLTEPARVRDEVARIGTPVIVQRMADPGVELLVGAVRDPTFGPIVAVGLGGVMAELVKDVRFALPPISEAEARALVTDGAAGKLLAGFRGTAAADVAGAVEIVLRIAQLAEDVPELAELDLNPVICGANGCQAVDARIRLSTVPAQSGPVKTW